MNIIQINGNLLKDVLCAELDEYRWYVESGGMDFNGAIFPTRERDMVLINGKINSAILRGLPDTETFTLTLNGQEIITTIEMVKAIGLALADHVQNTVDAAAYVRPLILSGEIITQEQIKIYFDNKMGELSTNG